MMYRTSILKVTKENTGGKKRRKSIIKGDNSVKISR